MNALTLVLSSPQISNSFLYNTCFSELNQVGESALWPSTPHSPNLYQITRVSGPDSDGGSRLFSSKASQRQERRQIARSHRDWGNSILAQSVNKLLCPQVVIKLPYLGPSDLTSSGHHNLSVPCSQSLADVYLFWAYNTVEASLLSFNIPYVMLSFYM